MIDKALEDIRLLEVGLWVYDHLFFVHVKWGTDNIIQIMNWLYNVVVKKLLGIPRHNISLLVDISLYGCHEYGFQQKSIIMISSAPVSFLHT